MPKKELSYKASLSPHQTVAHLENLVQALKQESICIQVGGDFLLFSLKGAPSIDWEVSALEKKGKNRLSLEFTWKSGQPEQEDTPPLKISNEAPADSETAPQKEDASPAAAAAPATIAAPPAKKAAPSGRTGARKPKVSSKKAAAPKKAKPAKKK